jgi:hypothetical protein
MYLNMHAVQSKGTGRHRQDIVMHGVNGILERPGLRNMEVVVSHKSGVAHPRRAHRVALNLSYGSVKGLRISAAVPGRVHNPANLSRVSGNMHCADLPWTQMEFGLDVVGGQCGECASQAVTCNRCGIWSAHAMSIMHMRVHWSCSRTGRSRTSLPVTRIRISVLASRAAASACRTRSSTRRLHAKIL